PAPLGGRLLRVGDDRADLLDLEAHPLGGDDLEVGVGAGEGRRAPVAAAAADLRRVGAGERSGEGARGHRAAGAGWSGDEPGVGHAAGAGPAGKDLPCRRGRRAQHADRLRLADDIVPHTHRAASTSGATAARTAAWTSSRGREESTTTYRSGSAAA